MHDVRVIKVLNMVQRSEASGPMVETDSLGRLAVEADDNWAVLARYQALDQALGILYTAETSVLRRAWPAESDFVAAIEDSAPGQSRVAVQLMKRPTLLYLDCTTGRFAQLLELFQRAIADRSLVAVGVFPGGNTISDARVIC